MNCPRRLSALAVVTAMSLGSLGMSLPVMAGNLHSGGDRPETIETVAAAETLDARARQAYAAGRFAEAVTLWQAAERLNRTDARARATLLGNLSLAYQQLGRWEEAKAAIATGMPLVADDRSSIAIQAQLLDTRGSLEFRTGQREAAFETWQQAIARHRQIDDRAAAVRTSINQIQAVLALGQYRRAGKLAEAIATELEAQPEGSLRAQGLLQLGEALLAAGKFAQARQYLEASLNLSSPPQVGGAYFALGRLAAMEGKADNASDFFQRAAAAATTPSDRARAELNRIDVLLEARRAPEAQTVLAALRDAIGTLPPSRDAIDAWVKYARHVSELQGNARAAADVLARASQTARTLGDRRAEAEALGALGHLYERTQQLAAARRLTLQALALSQEIAANDSTYRWQWQLGRVLLAMGDRNGAIAAYTAAAATLDRERGNLAALPEASATFRRSIEPVYRQLIGLLLDTDGGDRPKNLQKAQAAIESLQAAELVNFFRADCLQTSPQPLDRLAAKEAVFYPLLLGDRLAVMLRLPGQPLRSYSVPIPQERVNATVRELKWNLLDATSADYRTEAKQLYDWLIRPVAADLERSGVQTLVFVLDGSLRSVPMGVLFDGNRHLAEQYAIALTPGLQLLPSQDAAPQRELGVLTGGLAQAVGGFAPLPYVAEELTAIGKQLPAQTLLDRTFTRRQIEREITGNLPVVHLATHGKFGSTHEETFLLVWPEGEDGAQYRLSIADLNAILSPRALGQAIELLVLSACQTAVGDDRAALGLAGMAVRAGARSTVASLWSVSDRATAELMQGFYRNLRQPQVSKAEALRRAQLELLASTPYRHPYFWSPFVLVGNWQ